MVFIFLMVRRTPSVWKLTACLLKWGLSGLKMLIDGTKRFDFRKKEKNATKLAAQKITSNELLKFMVLKIPSRIWGVIGSLQACKSPNILLANLEPGETCSNTSSNVDIVTLRVSLQDGTAVNIWEWHGLK
jgi:hypothetical protein